jgi:hypothetical protein
MGEDAAQVLLEADAGLFGNTVGIRVDGPQKTLDFLPHLFIARLDAVTWLDVVAHL